jgi:SAM-dependent methyltransferase
MAADASRAVAGGQPRIIEDPVWGYRRLADMPPETEMDAFYESHYRDAIGSQARAQGLARLIRGGPDAERERDWLRATLYADVLDALIDPEALPPDRPRRSLDVGCGTGDLVAFLAEAGWAASGTEPSVEIADVGRARGLQIESLTGSAFIDSWRARGGQPYGAITLLNVLEHVRDPAALVMTLSEALESGGRLVVRVPNDFSGIQAAAQDHLGHEPWWIAVPDHLNYFDHASIAGLLARLGFEVVDVQADFPMELFLLMGDDYVADPPLGATVHERRRRLELALPGELRRSMGRAWVRAGIGRNTMVVARRSPSNEPGASPSRAI